MDGAAPSGFSLYGPFGLWPFWRGSLVVAAAARVWMSCTLQPDPSCSALSSACECNPCQTAARVPLTLALRAGVQSNHTLCTGYWAFVELDTATIPREQLYTEADAPTLSPHGRIFAGHPLTDANATSALPHALTLTLDTEYSAAARRYTSVDVFFSTASRPFAWDQTFRPNYPLSVFPAMSPIYSNLDRRKQQKQRKTSLKRAKSTKHHKKQRKKENGSLPLSPPVALSLLLPHFFFYNRPNLLCPCNGVFFVCFLSQLDVHMGK